jgi:hypothetical protein
MTAGLAAALAVALVAVVVLSVALVSSSRNLGKERRRADDAAKDLQTARVDLDASRAEATESRAEAADSAERARQSDELATHTARSRDDALRGAAAADERAAIAEQRAVSAEQRASAQEQAGSSARGEATDGGLWTLEKVRAEREWTDVVGAGIGLPVGWQPRVATVVAIELEIIREVIGTPATLHDGAGGGEVSPVVARLAIEVVRRVARVGEEMDVVVEADKMTISYEGTGSAPPDLSELAQAADEAGGALGVSQAGMQVLVALTYPR